MSIEVFLQRSADSQMGILYLPLQVSLGIYIFVIILVSDS